MQARVVAPQDARIGVSDNAATRDVAAPADHHLDVRGAGLSEHIPEPEPPPVMARMEAAGFDTGEVGSVVQPKRVRGERGHGMSYLRNAMVPSRPRRTAQPVMGRPRSKA